MELPIEQSIPIGKEGKNYKIYYYKVWTKATRNSMPIGRVGNKITKTNLFNHEPHQIHQQTDDINHQGSKPQRK